MPNFRSRSALTALVSLGEMEPAVLSVRPYKPNPGRFTCTVAPLVGDKGDTLPASALTVRTVKPWEMIVRPSPEMIAAQAKKNVELNQWSNCVAAVPYFLLDRNWFDGQERVNRQFWLTVKMPETAASSRYTTTVTIAGMGGKATLPFTVTVVPIKLGPAHQSISVNYSAPSYPDWFADLKAEGFFWKTVEADLRLMHDYGMTTVALLGGFDLPSEARRREPLGALPSALPAGRLRAAPGPGRHHELVPAGAQEPGGPLTAAWADAYEKRFRDYDAVAKRLGQKVMYSIGDETTNDGNEAYIRQVGEVAKARMSDLDLMSDINGYRELMYLSPLIDAVGFNNGWGGSYATNRPEHDLMTRDIIERVQKLGAKPWFINGGKGRYPYGIWFWKTTQWGQQGKIEWHYDASTADPYNPFDGTSSNDFGSLVLPQQTCTIDWELSREGVDDLRYLQRLDDLIAKHKDTQDPFLRGVVTRAQETRDFWSDCVDDRFTSAAHLGRQRPVRRARPGRRSASTRCVSRWRS